MSKGSALELEVSRTFDLVLNQFPLPSGSEAMSAIQRIELANTTPGWNLLWIDAICIDQSNVNERNHQVSMMGEIFSAAHFVVSWIGPGNKTSGKAVKTLRQHGDSMRAEELGFVEEWKSRAIRKKEKKHQKHQLSKKKKLSKLSKKDERMFEVLSRDYWQRLWVVQEFLLSRYVFVFYGTESVNWRRLRHVKIKSHEGSLMFHIITDKYECEERWEKNMHQTLASSLPLLIFKHMAKKCEDPRDKVYGLLGVSFPALENFEVDYSQSTEDMFVELLVEIELSTTGPLWGYYRHMLSSNLAEQLGLGEYPALSERVSAAINRFTTFDWKEASRREDNESPGMQAEDSA